MVGIKVSLPIVKCLCYFFVNTGFRGLFLNMQRDQKVSVHPLVICYRQVHRDFLITLYISLYKPFLTQVDSLFFIPSHCFHKAVLVL